MELFNVYSLYPIEPVRGKGCYVYDAAGSWRNRRIIACSGERTTESPRARSGRLAKASAGEGRYVLFAEPPQPLRRVFLRREGLILLRPLSTGRRRLPQRTTCGWFWRF